MNRSRIHLLIVDDDATQAAALREAFARTGYQVTVCTSSVQAATLAQRQEFQGLIVDCMLPRMNGVDLVEEINQVAITPPLVILYSGIFRDKAFAKDAMDRTGAACFLTKPLDLAELTGIVNSAFETTAVGEDSGGAGLIDLYGARVLKAKDLISIVSGDPTVHGVHVPMLYQQIQQARMTGELTMVTATGDLNSVSVYQGRIFGVRTPDKDSVFGGLAVSLGFVSARDVVSALQDPARKMLGQKLIESFSLSPHAIQLILEEQLALRLSQTIEDGIVTLDWSTRVYAPPEFSLSLERFRELAADWAVSKLDPDSIRAGLTNWGEYHLVGPPHPRVAAGLLNDLLDDPDFTPAVDLPHLLRQLINGNVRIGPKGEPRADYRFLETRLEHMLTAYQTQNHFQILGVGAKAQSREVNKAYADLSLHFDPVNLPEDCPARILVKCTQVYKYIETAYGVLNDEVNRHAYVLLMQNKRAQMMLENEPVLRAAIHQLHAGQYFEAATALQGLIDKRLDFPDLKSYRLWAGLSCDRRYKDLTLENVPPEERHSAPYQMARGMYYRSRGELAKALDAFGAAQALDPRLAPARSEFQRLRGEIEQRGGRTLLGEVTSLFTKTRRSG